MQVTGEDFILCVSFCGVGTIFRQTIGVTHANIAGHGEANGVGATVSSKLKRKRSESQMEVDNPVISRPHKRQLTVHQQCIVLSSNNILLSVLNSVPAKFYLSSRGYISEVSDIYLISFAFLNTFSLRERCQNKLNFAGLNLTFIGW